MAGRTAGETGSTSKGVQLVQHEHTASPRVRVWVSCNLQPKQYNNIVCGAEFSEDVSSRTKAGPALDKMYAVLLESLEARVKKAFAKLGFKFSA